MSAKGIPDVLSKSPEQGICTKILSQNTEV
jgi:hypothetical protein